MTISKKIENGYFDSPKIAFKVLRALVKFYPNVHFRIFYTARLESDSTGGVKTVTKNSE